MFFTRTRFKLFVNLLLVFSLYPAIAIAQERVLSNHESIFPFFELTAIFGKTTGGHLSHDEFSFEFEDSEVSGIILGYSLNSRTTLEFRYAHENPKLFRTEFTWHVYEIPMDYYHLGIRRDLSSQTIIPYGYLGIGLAHQDPDIIYSPYYPFDETVSFETSTDFSGRIEFGIRSYFGYRKDIGLRAGLEVVPIFYSATSHIIPADPMVMDGWEKISWDGDIIWRWAVTIGMSFKFQV